MHSPKHRISHIVLVLAVAATALTTPAFAGDGASSPAKDWIRNRYNSDQFPVISCPAEGTCVAPNCSRFPNTPTGTCYDTSGDHPYWDAVRINIAGGDRIITQCAEYATILNLLTWNGDQTGSVGEVREKQNAVSARAWLDGEEVNLLENPRTHWEFQINSRTLAPGGVIPSAPAQRIVNTCDNYMANSGDCPPEISRDNGENCYVKTFGYDLSHLSEGMHTFTLEVYLDKGFPNATNCKTTRPNCYDASTTPHPQEFGDDEPCTRTLTIHIDNQVPGGC